MDEKTPIAQLLKVMTVLNIVPGHASKPEIGEPIAIVTLGHNGEVEQPLMFDLKDVKRLAYDMMRVLAHHGDEEAQKIAAEHFGCTCGGSHEPPPAQPTREAPRRTNVRTDDRIEITVTFRDARVKPLVLEVLGGCSCQRRTILLFRCGALGAGTEAVAMVASHRTIRFKGLPLLNQDTADRLKTLTANQGFRNARLWWRKLPKQVLKRQFGGKQFRCVD